MFSNGYFFHSYPCTWYTFFFLQFGNLCLLSALETFFILFHWSFSLYTLFLEILLVGYGSFDLFFFKHFFPLFSFWGGINYAHVFSNISTEKCFCNYACDFPKLFLLRMMPLSEQSLNLWMQCLLKMSLKILMNIC